MPDQAKIKHRRIRRTSILLILALVFFIVPFSMTAKPKNCESCHTMKPYYDSWQRSVHKKWACGKCHQYSGMLGAVAYRAGFITEVAAEVFDVKNLDNPGTREPKNDSCLGPGCHSGNIKQSPDAFIKIDHRLHLKNKSYNQCIDCHRKVVHDNLEGQGRALPLRKLCFECHKKKAERECNYCHTRRNVNNYPDFAH